MRNVAKTFGKLTPATASASHRAGGGAADAVIDKPVATDYAQKNSGFTILSEELGVEQYGIAPSVPWIVSCVTPSRPQ